MRGFRGSRAAQNELAHRHGRHDQPQFQQVNGRYPSPGAEQGAQRPALPDWLKTAETRAKEAELARHPAAALPAAVRPILRAVANPPTSQHTTRPEMPAQQRARPELKIVKAATPVVAATKPIAAKKKAAATPKKATTAAAKPKAKAATKRSPARRKAA